MTLTYYSPGRKASGAGRAGAPSAGGNALGHRPGTVPGTTLYTPASMCVPPTLHTKLTERDPQAPLLHKLPPSPTAAGAGTTYATFHRFPEGVDYSVDPRLRRPTAMTEQSAQPPSPEVPTFGRSTYQMEVLQRSTADINGSGSGSCAGRIGGACSSASAPSSPAHRPSIAAARPGYLTTSAAATAPVADRYSALSGSTGVCRSAGSSPAAPAAASAAAAAVGSRGGSSGGGSLFDSSLTAACLRDLPMLARAGAAAAAAGAASAGSTQPRPGKDAVYLHALDQHSRGRLPGYTGHRPHHNVSLELPPPSKLTTWGAASQAALRRPLPPPEQSHGIKSSLLEFFSTGTSAASQGFVSENGLAEASRFHETTRPLEGRMPIPRPSATARRGAKFTG